MEKILGTLTIAVDEATKKISVELEYDCDIPESWEDMSLAQKIAATFQFSSAETVKAVLGSHREEQKEPVTGGDKYPCRCRIVDPTGDTREVAGGTVVLNAPDVSKPKVGRLGWAHKEGSTVRIELDDGSTLMGYECWWEPIADVN